MVELGDFLLKKRDKKLNLSPPEEMWNWKRGRRQSSVAVVFFREVACCSAATLLLPCCSAAAGKDNVKQVLSWNHSNTCFFASIVRTVWLTSGSHMTIDQLTNWPLSHLLVIINQCISMTHSSVLDECWLQNAWVVLPNPQLVHAITFQQLKKTKCMGIFWQVHTFKGTNDTWVVLHGKN